MTLASAYALSLASLFESAPRASSATTKSARRGRPTESPTRAVPPSHPPTSRAGLPLSATALSLCIAATTVACGSRRRTNPNDGPTAPTAAPSASATASAPRVRSDELEPGNERAFNITMPTATDRLSVHDNTAIFFVHHPMPRVMRYLQRRLEIVNGDIHPLGAMIRNARVVTTVPGTTQDFVDVSVRDENGDGTLVTFWRRVDNVRQFATPGEALRAAGFDPATGHPLPGNND